MTDEESATTADSEPHRDAVMPPAHTPRDAPDPSANPPAHSDSADAGARPTDDRDQVAAAAPSSATNHAHSSNDTPEDADETVQPPEAERSPASSPNPFRTYAWVYDTTATGEVTPGRAATRQTQPGPSQSRRSLLAVALATGLVAGAVGGAAASRLTQDTPPVSEQVQISRAPQTTAVAADWVTNVSTTVQPSVVSVIATRDGVPFSTGSGVVMTDDGHIMTNAHVVSGATDVSVRLSDATTLPAEISGSDSIYDIAVIKVQRTLPAAAFNVEPVQVGEPVAAFGAPLGLYGTVTVGIVSAVARPVTASGEGGDTSIVSAIQTDAAVNPGNSGGPLVNANGEVVGVNSSIATLSAGPGSGSIGLGFAIPSATAVRVGSELAERGYAERPLIGVSIGPGEPFGARIDGLTDGGPAQAAGLLVGDVLTAVNGTAADTPVAAIALIRSATPGKSVRLTILRDGTLMDIDVVSQAESGPIRTNPEPAPVPSGSPPTAGGGETQENNEQSAPTTAP